MGEFKPDYRRILNESEILRQKEDAAFLDKKPFVPEHNGLPDEARELGQELQRRAKDLRVLYEDTYGFKVQNLISDNTIESLTACLEPGRAEYVLAHLKELDALAARAEYEPRLLPKAQMAIETWEKLEGALPTDLVEDGLRVDAYAMMNLKKYIDNLKNPVMVTAHNNSAGQILDRLRRTNPKLVSLVEGMEPFEVGEE